MLPFWFLGYETMIILIPAFILAMYAQSKVKSTYAHYSRIGSVSGMSGADVARRLLDEHNLHDVGVELTGGQLSDHYDPRKRVVRLSREVFNGTSLAALGIAAHETGHAIQHSEQYLPLGMRNSIQPVAALGSNLAFPLFFIGFLFSGGGMGFLMDVGILFFLGAVVFQLLTLPVEYNASSRAVALLGDRRILVGKELAGAKAVLNAAALTYLAATAVAVAQLIRLLILRGRGRD